MGIAVSFLRRNLRTLQRVLLLLLLLLLPRMLLATEMKMLKSVFLLLALSTASSCVSDQSARREDLSTSGTSHAVFARRAKLDLQDDKSGAATTIKTPMLEVSFNLRELIERCQTAGCRVNDEMRIREPFYVEEPGWIQINRPNSFARRLGKNDPFFGTRGKKDSTARFAEAAERSELFDGHRIGKQERERMREERREC